MSTPRFEHGVARIGEQILAFGGFDASYDCLTKASFKVLYQSQLLFEGGCLEPRDTDMEACWL